LDVLERNFYSLGAVALSAGEKTVGGTVVNQEMVNGYDEMAEETGSMEGDTAIHTAVSLVGSDGSPAASSFLGRETDPYGDCAFTTDHRGELPGGSMGPDGELRCRGVRNALLHVLITESNRGCRFVTPTIQPWPRI
jgi:hypothetical protein